MALVDELKESIEDVKFGISKVSIVTSEERYIIFELETVENQTLTIKLDNCGYQIINTNAVSDTTLSYESLNSLLHHLSAGYSERFFHYVSTKLSENEDI